MADCCVADMAYRVIRTNVRYAIASVCPLVGALQCRRDLRTSAGKGAAETGDINVAYKGKRLKESTRKPDACGMSQFAIVVIFSTC